MPKWRLEPGFTPLRRVIGYFQTAQRKQVSTFVEIRSRNSSLLEISLEKVVQAFYGSHLAETWLWRTGLVEKYGLVQKLAEGFASPLLQFITDEE